MTQNEICEDSKAKMLRIVELFSDIKKSKDTEDE